MPPVLVVKAPSVVDGNTVTLKGQVTDDVQVKDLFVRVYNKSSKLPAKKVFYLPNRGEKNKLPFSADVPLWPGSNIIQVFARETTEVQSVATLIVMRKSGPSVAQAPQPEGQPGQRHRHEAGDPERPFWYDHAVNAEPANQRGWPESGRPRGAFFRSDAGKAAESRSAAGRHPSTQAAAGGRRRRIGQDPRHHLPPGAPAGRRQRRPPGDGGDLHQQGRRRAARTGGQAAGDPAPRLRRAVDRDVPLAVCPAAAAIR